MADILGAGRAAPEFNLSVTPDLKLTLGELRGKPVVLAFFPADWSPVCGDQMTLYNEILPEFAKYGAQLVGILADGAWCHGAFSAARRLHTWSFESPVGVNPGADGILDALEDLAKRKEAA